MVLSGGERWGEVGVGEEVSMEPHGNCTENCRNGMKCFPSCEFWISYKDRERLYISNIVYMYFHLGFPGLDTEAVGRAAHTQWSEEGGGRMQQGTQSCPCPNAASSLCSEPGLGCHHSDRDRPTTFSGPSRFLSFLGLPVRRTLGVLLLKMKIWD